MSDTIQTDEQPTGVHPAVVPASAPSGLPIDLNRWWPLLLAGGLGAGAGGVGGSGLDLMGLASLRADVAAIEVSIDRVADDVLELEAEANEHRFSPGHVGMEKRMDSLEGKMSTMRVLARNQVIICQAMGLQCVEPVP